MSDETRVLILGGTGYLGQHVAATLRQRLGASHVVIGARKPKSTAGEAEFRRVDAFDLQSLDRGLEGVTHIVNCVMGDAATMVGVARNIATVAIKHRIQNVVHLSSTAVYGQLSGDLDESSEVDRELDWYGAAKLESERIINEARESGLSTVVLRPALIYGPGSEQWTLRIGRLLVSHRLGDLTGRGEGLCNLVHVQDVATAVSNALFMLQAAGRTFNLAAPNPVTWNRYLTDLGDALGIKRRFIPSWKLGLEGKLLVYPLKIWELVMRKLGYGGAAPAAMTPSLISLFGHRVRYHSSAAEILLPSGWVPYEDGIRESAIWLRLVLRKNSR